MLLECTEEHIWWAVIRTLFADTCQLGFAQRTRWLIQEPPRISRSCLVETWQSQVVLTFSGSSLFQASETPREEIFDHTLGGRLLRAGCAPSGCGKVMQFDMCKMMSWHPKLP